MTKKWEYLVVDLFNVTEEQQAILNGLGKDGWELVAVTPTTGWDGQGTASQSRAYLKREKA